MQTLSEFNKKAKITLKVTDIRKVLNYWNTNNILPKHFKQYTHYRITKYVGLEEVIKTILLMGVAFENHGSYNAYLLQSNTSHGRVLKVGISNTLIQRVRTLDKEWNTVWELLGVINFPSKHKALGFEQAMHTVLRTNMQLPVPVNNIDGYTEVYLFSQLIIDMFFNNSNAEIVAPNTNVLV